MDKWINILFNLVSLFVNFVLVAKDFSDIKINWWSNLFGGSDSNDGQEEYVPDRDYDTARNRNTIEPAPYLSNVRQADSNAPQFTYDPEKFLKGGLAGQTSGNYRPASVGKGFGAFFADKYSEGIDYLRKQGFIRTQNHDYKVGNVLELVKAPHPSQDWNGFVEFAHKYNEIEDIITSNLHGRSKANAVNFNVSDYAKLFTLNDHELDNFRDIAEAFGSRNLDGNDFEEYLEKAGYDFKKIASDDFSNGLIEAVGDRNFVFKNFINGYSDKDYSRSDVVTGVKATQALPPNEQKARIKYNNGNALPEDILRNDPEYGTVSLQKELVDNFRFDREEQQKYRKDLEDEKKYYRSEYEEAKERRLGLEDRFIQEYDKDRQKYLDDYLRRQKETEKYIDDYGDVRDQRADLIEDLRNAPSTVEEQARQSLEQSLRNAAALSATLPTRAGGSAAKALSDQARTHNAQIAANSSVARMQEKFQRDGLVADMLAGQASLTAQQYGISQGSANSSLAAAQEAARAFQLKGAVAQNALQGQSYAGSFGGTTGGQIGNAYGQGFQASNAALGGAFAQGQQAVDSSFNRYLQQQQLNIQKTRVYTDLIGSALGAGANYAGLVATGGKK